MMHPETHIRARITVGETERANARQYRQMKADERQRPRGKRNAGEALYRSTRRREARSSATHDAHS